MENKILELIKQYEFMTSYLVFTEFMEENYNSRLLTKEELQEIKKYIRGVK